MRRVLSLLLTAAMVLSLLLVVAGADQQTVTLKTAKSVNGNEVTYTFTLDASKSDGVGALSFDVDTTGLTFKEVVYNNGGTELDKVFKPQGGLYSFTADKGRFLAYGGDYEANRLLTGSVVLIAVTYTIEDTVNYSLNVKEFKACYSGARAMTEDKYNCVAAPITDGGSTGDYDITPVGKGDNTPAYEVEDTSLTVTYSMPCAVAYTTDGGATYTRIKATSGSDGSYVYDLADIPADAKISVVVKGDVNGDGQVKQNDKAYLSRHLASWTGYETLPQPLAADVNGDGQVKQNDKAYLSRHLASWSGYESLNWEVQ